MNSNTQHKMEKMIHDIATIIRDNLYEFAVERDELENTNKSILNLPVVKKVIYAYEDRKPLSEDGTNVLFNKIDVLEESVHTIIKEHKQIDELTVKYNTLFEYVQNRELLIEKMQSQMEILMNMVVANKPDREEEPSEPIKLEIEELDSSDEPDLLEEEEIKDIPFVEQMTEALKKLTVEEEDDKDEIETETSEIIEQEEEVQEEPEPILEEEDEEEEVFEIEIDDVSYFATHEENGILYEVDENGEPGKQVGILKDGEPFFS